MDASGYQGWGLPEYRIARDGPGLCRCKPERFSPVKNYNNRSGWEKRKSGPGSYRVFPFPPRARRIAAAPRPARTGTGDRGVNVVRVGTVFRCVVWDAAVVWTVCVSIMVGDAATGVGVALVGAIPPRYQGAVSGLVSSCRLRSGPYPWPHPGLPALQYRLDSG